MLLRVFTGPMWSGKTSGLIQTLTNPLFHPCTKRVHLKHAIDTRSPAGVIAARTGEVLRDVVSTASLAAIPTHAGTLYAIDEAQFFGEELLEFWERLCAAQQREACVAKASTGNTAVPCATGLVVAGLDLDFKRQEFGAVMKLCRRVMGVPDAANAAVLHTPCGLSVDFQFTRMTARCSHRGAHTAACGHAACYSQRLAEGGEGRVQVGGSNYYQPACPVHHSLHPIALRDWDPTHTLTQ